MMIIIDVLGDAEESSVIDDNEASGPVGIYPDATKIPQLQIVELSRDDRPHVITPAQALGPIGSVNNDRGSSIN